MPVPNPTGARRTGPRGSTRAARQAERYGTSSTTVYDLHLHVLVGVDDGARTLDESHAMVTGLAALGYRKVVTTPHIRDGLFPNSPESLLGVFAEWRDALLAREGALPELALGAEHHLDATCLELANAKRLLAYPDGRSVLVELPYETLPPRLSDACFRIALGGYKLVLAHPERNRVLRENRNDPWPFAGSKPKLLLDLLALEGEYGAEAERAACDWLDLGYYDAACSDLHRPSQLPKLKAALETLERRWGRERRELLLEAGPSGIANP